MLPVSNCVTRRRFEFYHLMIQKIIRETMCKLKNKLHVINREKERVVSDERDFVSLINWVGGGV